MMKFPAWILLILVILVSGCAGQQGAISPEPASAAKQTAPPQQQVSAPAQTGANLPDLLIAGNINFEKGSAGFLSVSYTVQNQGDAAATDVLVGVEVTEKATGKAIYPEEVINKGSIGPSSSQIGMKYYKLSDGQYNIRIRADPLERIAESDEDNNVLTKDFSAPLT